MNKRKLILSTDNENKIEEIRHILKEFDIEVLSKIDIGLENIKVVEDGSTLEENSIKKARALSERTDYMVMADDSGLFVDALNGEPGVHSSRYSGEDGNYRRNNLKLLESLKDVAFNDRKAAFRSVIALITEDKILYTVEGECRGSIGFEMKGTEDFGYDPLFIPEGYENTFAELGHDIKDRISHRARALDGLKDTLAMILSE